MPTGSESNIVFDEKLAVASRTGVRHVYARGGEGAQGAGRGEDFGGRKCPCMDTVTL